MATHSSALAWRTPWTEEPGGLQSMGLQSQAWLSNHHSLPLIRQELHSLTRPNYSPSLGCKARVGEWYSNVEKITLWKLRTRDMKTAPPGTQVGDPTRRHTWDPTLPQTDPGNNGIFQVPSSSLLAGGHFPVTSLVLTWSKQTDLWLGKASYRPLKSSDCWGIFIISPKSLTQY